MAERIRRDRSLHIGGTFWLLAAGRKVRIHDLLSPEKPLTPPPKLTLGPNFTVNLCERYAFVEPVIPHRRAVLLDTCAGHSGTLTRSQTPLLRLLRRRLFILSAKFENTDLPVSAFL